MANRRTIFITSFFGLISRNILSTNVFDLLVKRNFKVVVLAPESKTSLYREKFQSDNVLIEGVDLKPFSRAEKFFFSLFLNASDTDSRRICRSYDARLHNRWLGFFFWTVVAKLSNLSVFRSLLRRLDYIFMNKRKFSRHFDEYSPDAVFATDIFEPNDVDVIRTAKAMGVPVIGMVRSWDNITSHGLNRIIPDKLVVNTPRIKEEALRYADMAAENICVVGIPHYDNYIRAPRRPKTELFRELNLDPGKKTVFFAPPPAIFIDENPVNTLVLKRLKSMDVQLILRLYFVGDVDLGDLKPVPNKIAIDRPALGGSDSVQTDLRWDDRLADLIYHSDAVIAFASTLAVDAVVFGKPVVFIGFDGTPDFPRWKSLRRFYDFDHQRLLLKTGGVRLAKNLDELANFVNEYLDNPSLDREGRERIISELCWKLDGRSSARLADFLTDNIK